jgi:ATP/maltotriose-dependent transcriptional regulator MalT
VFDPFTAKLLRPLLRPGTVRHSPLIERLARGDPRPIVSVVAPAGYGKTTLLSQGVGCSAAGRLVPVRGRADARRRR